MSDRNEQIERARLEALEAARDPDAEIEGVMLLIAVFLVGLVVGAAVTAWLTLR